MVRGVRRVSAHAGATGLMHVCVRACVRARRLTVQRRARARVVVGAAVLNYMRRTSAQACTA